MYCVVANARSIILRTLFVRHVMMRSPKRRLNVLGAARECALELQLVMLDVLQDEENLPTVDLHPGLGQVLCV